MENKSDSKQPVQTQVRSQAFDISEEFLEAVFAKIQEKKLATQKIIQFKKPWSEVHKKKQALAVSCFNGVLKHGDVNPNPPIENEEEEIDDTEEAENVSEDTVDQD